jgi:hypothetical protein
MFSTKNIKLSFLFAVLFCTFSCTKEASEALKPTEVVKTRQNKSANLYSSEVVALANSPLFIGYYNALHEFVSVPYTTFMNILPENQSAYDITYEQLKTAYVQTPSTNTANAVVAHLGFVDFEQYVQKSVLIQTKKNTLVQNYTRFVNLTNGEIIALIDEANEYTDTQSVELPGDFIAYKNCMTDAAQQQAKDLENAGSRPREGVLNSIVATYLTAAGMCKILYGKK